MESTSSTLTSEGLETAGMQQLERPLENESGLACALRTDAVLERILEQLDVRHLKIVRQVCKLWNTEACRVLRSKSSVKCKSQKDESLFCQALSRSSEETRALPSPFRFISLANADDAQKRLESLARFSKEGLRVWSLVLFVDEDKLLGSIKQFPYLSLTLTELTIYGIDSSEVETCDFQLPSLKRLDISQHCPQRPSTSPNSTDLQFKLKILSGAPNLRALWLTLFGSNESSIRAAQSLLRSCASKDLEELSITGKDFSMYPTTLMHLVNATRKFHLHHLHLNFWWVDGIQNEEQNQAMTELVKAHSRSIKHVNLMEVDGINYQLLSKEFPECPNMEILVLPQYHLGSGISCKNPALRTLQVTDLVFDSELDYQNAPSFPKVTNVGFKSIKGAKRMYSVAQNALLILLKQFPNASAWDMPLHNVSGFCELLRSGEILCEW